MLLCVYVCCYRLNPQLYTCQARALPLRQSPDSKVRMCMCVHIFIFTRVYMCV